jgi:hypothetical protein
MAEFRAGSHVWWTRPDADPKWWNNPDGLPKSVAGRVKSVNKEEGTALITRTGPALEDIPVLVPLDDLQPRSIVDKRGDL